MASKSPLSIQQNPWPMQTFRTNDNVILHYFDSASVSSHQVESSSSKPVLILIHGFTGSSLYWQRQIPFFSQKYRVIAPDLRNHGSNSHQPHGFQVSRLAMDLHQLLRVLGLVSFQDSSASHQTPEVAAIGSSLGAAILWCYASLFTTKPFDKMIFVDQSPLQNLSASNGDDWDLRYCNRGMNIPTAVANLQTTLATTPANAHHGTIASCLAYRSHNSPTQYPWEPKLNDEIWKQDEHFFLTQAMKGNQIYFGKLMADHTALDWRSSIAATFGPESGSETKVLVVASSRSGCFPAEGPMKVVELVNGANGAYGKARGEIVEWGGHWCFWEDPEKFNELCQKFLHED